jgi:hypothetical protein
MKIEQPIKDLFSVYILITVIFFVLRKLLERGVKKVSPNFFFVNSIFWIEKILLFVSGGLVCFLFIIGVSLGHLSYFYNLLALVLMQVLIVFLFRIRDVHAKMYENQYQKVLISDEHVVRKVPLVVRIVNFVSDFFNSFWISLVRGVSQNKLKFGVCSSFMSLSL